MDKTNKVDKMDENHHLIQPVGKHLLFVTVISNGPVGLSIW
jgi:hypothetical protein